MRAIEFTAVGFADFLDLLEIDRKVASRVARLIIETAKEPFQGIGKPEPLKGDMKGLWSRRIDQEHRLVYQVTDARITIVTCREHYRR